MSDGPHRTLSMRRCWKKLAERADNAAYTPNELRDYARAALEEDLAKEVRTSAISAILEAADDIQSGLFSDQIDMLDHLNYDQVQHPMARTLLDCLKERLEADIRSPSAVINAVQDTLEIFGSRCARQVEEHYLRDSSKNRADKVRSRIDQALSSTDYSGIAHSFIRSERPARLIPVKQSGIDDGIRIQQ